MKKLLFAICLFLIVFTASFAGEIASRKLKLVETLEIRCNGYQLYNLDVVQVGNKTVLCNSQGGIVDITGGY
jgi:hypothetical protein